MRGNEPGIIIVDDVYSNRCEPRFTLYPKYRQPQTLADYERAAAVFMRDTEMTRLRIEWRLHELREQEERGRALSCVAPLPHTHHD